MNPLRSELNIPFSPYLHCLLPFPSLPPQLRFRSGTGSVDLRGGCKLLSCAWPGVICDLLAWNLFTLTTFFDQRPLSFLSGTLTPLLAHVLLGEPRLLRFKRSWLSQLGQESHPQARLICPLGTESTVSGAHNTSRGSQQCFHFS